jgi:predicted regulator of Ras-like GTPase activity (Roadblock/LC7/MglB family)
VFKKILADAVEKVSGAKAAIFLDGEGEAIEQAGEHTGDIKFLAAWKEIHLDHIREIAERLRLGAVHAVLFSHDDGNELIIPVSGEYCLLVFLSSYAHVNEAMKGLREAVELLKKEME